MAATEKRPILIVGAGTTGLTLACVLARHGASFRIIDKLSELRPYARAVGIHSRTLEIFQDLGIVDAVVEQSAIAVSINQFAEGEQILRAIRSGRWPLSVHGQPRTVEDGRIA